MKKLILAVTTMMTLSAVAGETYNCKEMNHSRDEYTVKLSRVFGDISRVTIKRVEDNFVQAFSVSSKDFKSGFSPNFVDERSPLDQADLTYAEKLKYKVVQVSNSEELYVSEPMLRKAKEGIVVLIDGGAYGPIGSQRDLYTYLRCKKNK